MGLRSGPQATSMQSSGFHPLVAVITQTFVRELLGEDSAFIYMIPTPRSCQCSWKVFWFTNYLTTFQNANAKLVISHLGTLSITSQWQIRLFQIFQYVTGRVYWLQKILRNHKIRHFWCPLFVHPPCISCRPRALQFPHCAVASAPVLLPSHMLCCSFSLLSAFSQIPLLLKFKG